MFGLIVGCVAVTLLADAALNPDNRRAARARLRRWRLARTRARQAERVADIGRERVHARKMRAIAEAQLPHLRAVLTQAQRDHHRCVANDRPSQAARHSDTINKTLAEITSLEPWLEP